MNENMDSRKCKGKQNCQGGVECLSHELWSDLSEMIDGFLEHISLQQLIDKRSKVKEIKFA
jgi:Rrf2 family iron-sulfur cluster assembly transcriptional regulator